MPYSRLGHRLIVSCSTDVRDFFPPPFMKMPGDCPWDLAKQVFQFLSGSPPEILQIVALQMVDSDYIHTKPLIR